MKLPALALKTVLIGGDRMFARSLQERLAIIDGLRRNVCHPATLNASMHEVQLLRNLVTVANVIQEENRCG